MEPPENTNPKVGQSGDSVDASVRPVMLAPDWHPINCIDEFILACGWTWESGGFIPPESWVEKIAIRYGLGRHWSRCMAAQFCIQYYEEGHAAIPWPNAK
ncbi:MAG: hypothetical protein WCS65_17960 [Verrucomicrobiae bacterium]